MGELFLAAEPKWGFSAEGCQREVVYRWKLPVTPEQRTLAAMETVVESQRTQLCWPYIWPLRNPWSCIFCQIKDLKKRFPESQPIYQESEILQKRMLPREQLVSWNVNLSPLLSVYTREGAPSCREHEEECPRQTAVPWCVLITLPDTKLHKPQKIPILCLFWEVCRFGGCALIWAYVRAHSFQAAHHLKISSIFGRNVSFSSWRSIALRKAPFLSQNHVM